LVMAGVSRLLPLFLPLLAISQQTGIHFPPLPDGFHSDVDEISLSAGHYHTCAIEARAGVEFGGTVKCWGYNSHGQSSPPSGIFVQISSGHMHTCGILLDETVSCWGSIMQSEVPRGLFTQVSSGEHHACGVLKDGSLSCWGRNDYGEGKPPAGTFVQVSCGNANTCGLRSNGIVECWGKNYMGQSEPPDGVLFKQISVSLNHHGCGLELGSVDSESGGGIRCWGNNNRGQAEDKLGEYDQVSTGFMSSCGVRSDKGIDCWGVAVPIPHESDETGENIYDQISLGSDHACGVRAEDGSLECWAKGVDMGGAEVPHGFEVA